MTTIAWTLDAILTAAGAVLCVVALLWVLVEVV